jgi:hypothetical protein
MGQRQLRIVFIVLIAGATAACRAGAAIGVPSPTPAAVTSAVPTPTLAVTSAVSSPSPTPPTPSRAATATLTLQASTNADGPGISVAEALAYVGVEPLLVNGMLLKTADGTIWLCGVLEQSSPPQCAEPRLLVENGTLEDPAFINGAGLHVSGGVRWVDHVQLFGFVHP